MFSSSYFNPEYFNEYFKITGEVVDDGSGTKSVVVNLGQLRSLKLRKEDEDILEFIVSFVLSH